VGRPAPFSRGALIGADSLSNTTIGGPKGTVLAYRFRSTWTGAAAAVRFYIIFNAAGRGGYSGGTLGRMRVTMTDDAEGAPGRVLASTVIQPTPRESWPLVRFDAPPAVAAGQRYHVVFTNIDPNPRRNYASVNAFVQRGHGEDLPALPAGLSALLGSTTDGGATPVAWRPRAISRGDRYVPILDVVGTEDQHLGIGYMEAWVSRPKPIGGRAGVRQVFVTTTARGVRVSGAWLRVKRRGGASAPLRLRLEKPGGHVLAGGIVPAARVSSDSPEWVHVRFRRPVELGPGVTAALRAAASSPSSYSTFPVRKGTDFGFDARTVFTGGYAQFTRGGRWTGWDQWGVSDRHDGDLQFALDLQ
jgi:hypothetical protein